jgi:hypothetical protein
VPPGGAAAAAHAAPADLINLMARRSDAAFRLTTFGGASAAPRSAAARSRRARVAVAAPAAQRAAGARARKRLFSLASGRGTAVG